MNAVFVLYDQMTTLDLVDPYDFAAESTTSMP